MKHINIKDHLYQSLFVLDGIFKSTYYSTIWFEDVEGDEKQLPVECWELYFLDFHSVDPSSE